jgi:hypothetical protein
MALGAPCIMLQNRGEALVMALQQIAADDAASSRQRMSFQGEL